MNPQISQARKRDQNSFECKQTLLLVTLLQQRFNLQNTILARFESIASDHGWGDCSVAVTPDLVALIKSGNFGSAHLDDLGVGLQPFLCVPQTAQQRAQSDTNLQLYDMYIDGTSTLHMQELQTAQAQYKIRFPSTFGQTILTLRTFHILLAMALGDLLDKVCDEG